MKKKRTTNMKLDLGENLCRLRREKNMTQEELAERMGVTDRSVSRWECGVSPG